MEARVGAGGAPGAVWDDELRTGIAAARAAGDAALTFFGRTSSVAWKLDDSPVGEADHAADAAIRRWISAAFPQDGILTEESAETPGTSGRRWIVDPVDGTRCFLRGLPYWANLIALEADGDVTVGVVHLPALGKLYAAARGGGAWRGGDRLELREGEDPSRCLLVYGEPDRILRVVDAAAFRKLVGAVGWSRCYGAPYGAALLLDGHADAWIEGDVSLWDIAAFRVLLEEAGARFTDLAGERRWPSRSGLAARPSLHAALLDVLRQG